MRRMLLTATGVTALVLATPGAALAHHRHHHAKHHARHARVSFRHLGPRPAGKSSTPSSNPTPTTPTTPTTEENAGKVTSYTGGVLTITLGDGSTVSGKVTINTRFKCISATAPQPQGGAGDEPGQDDDNGQGDDRGQGDGNQQGGPPWQNGQQGGPQGGGQWQQGGGPNGPGGDWNEAPISNEPPCDSSALVEGAVVRAAELRIAPPGAAEFEWITLVR